MNEVLLILVLALICVVPAAPLVTRFVGDRAPYILAVIPAAMFAVLVMSWQDVDSGSTFRYVVNWIPALDVNASWMLDGLSLTFALLVLGMGTVILIYSRGYMIGDDAAGKFYAYFFLFMAAMLGLALSDNVMVLFMFWELTSISSYMLIGHKHSAESSRDSALQALIVTGGGGLALMGGLVLLALAAGSWEISEIILRSSQISQSKFAIPALVLIAAGAFTKSAQAPFHFWLPNAMAAPTPVSAYLHSATMVKAGVFLLARLHPALSDLWLWTPLIATTGGITMLGAAWQALREVDLKRILAYSTVSSLGTMVFLLGLGHPSAVKAAIAFMLGHALYKGALFMITGTIDHETGTRNLAKLGGLRKAMPFTAAATALAAFSMAGLPPAFGYLGKETLFAASLDADGIVVLLIAAALVASILNFAIAGKVALGPFTGSKMDTPKQPHEGHTTLWLPPMFLAVLGLAIGAGSDWIGSEIIGPASNAVAGETISTTLHLWPGLGQILALSAITIAAGSVVYVLRRRIFEVPIHLGYGGSGVFTLLNRGLLKWSARLTRTVQNGQISQYISIVVLFAAALLFTAMFFEEAFRWPGNTIPVRPHEIVIAIAILLSSLMAAFTRSRLIAIAALGASGYGISTLFVIYGAPDLGMTQILVETLTVVLLVSVYRFLPATGNEPSSRRRRRDAFIALAGGTAISVVALSAISSAPASSITDFFRANSKTGAQGSNVVNTILVDFRALDTLGEISVLAAAAIGVIALLRLRLGRVEKK